MDEQHAVIVPELCAFRRFILNTQARDVLPVNPALVTPDLLAKPLNVCRPIIEFLIGMLPFFGA
ncbi:MAG TPA: hypothetical protein PK137_00630 [Anaerolineaceae bacterium]|nr:hypothetical protein [Anaerolineaceae bacterium]HOR84006.1 hypothetical protein [Anaerolineaceae bacterium]HPL42342.1 hypothetical protein [Anaerolineaceae bacterium]